MAYDAIPSFDRVDALIERFNAVAAGSPFGGSSTAQNTRPPRPLTSSGLFMAVKHESPVLSARAIRDMASSMTLSSARHEQSLTPERETHDNALSLRGFAPYITSPKQGKATGDLHVSRVRDKSAQANEKVSRQPSPPPLVVPQPVRKVSNRSVSGHSQSTSIVDMADVEQLEATAEKLSMTSSIDDAIREMHDEQKRAESRRSSLLSSPMDVPVTRQFSGTGSIRETNSAARSGGYSPGGFMLSPKESLSGSQWGRSGSRDSRSSQVSRLSRPQPEDEGWPLDSLVLVHSQADGSSRSTSGDEKDESSTMTRARPSELVVTNPTEDEERPATPTSQTSFEHAQKMFHDFDGEHYSPRPVEESGVDASQELHADTQMEESSWDNIRSREPSGSHQSILNTQRKSSGNYLARPKSYADPLTGQQMVFYPAPVPTMLNLPQKLSRRPPMEVVEQRRSRVLNTMPTARTATTHLPVTSEEGDVEVQQDNVLLLDHRQQRHDLQTRKSHVPPQLRANAFFELPSLSQTVEIREESAVATLDDILDASAYAPVNAFTDHAFAGRLGAEVYGPSHRNQRSISQPSGHGFNPALQQRKSASTLLGWRSSSMNMLDAVAETTGTEQRRSTMSGLFGFRKFSGKEHQGGVEGDYAGIEMDDLEQKLADDENDEDEDEAEDNEMDGQFDDELYQGPPTTLLAELQLRKQQQKQRTKPLHEVYPSGVHATLLELDAVAQVEKKSRNVKRVNLAWENPDLVARERMEEEDDDDVPLGVLYQAKSKHKADQPMGLLEKRDVEDNEPLSRRRDRLQGRPVVMQQRSSRLSRFDLVTPSQRAISPPESLIHVEALPETRPVSRAFSTELMSQFGSEIPDKGKARESTKTPVLEEEETLGQRRKRLQVEREAREKELEAGGAEQSQRPILKTRRSMADILQAHPVGAPAMDGKSTSGPGSGVRTPSYSSVYAERAKPMTTNGLLGLQDRQAAQRSSTMLTGNGAYPNARQASQAVRSSMMFGGQGSSYMSSQMMNTGSNLSGSMGMNMSYGNIPYGNMPYSNNQYSSSRTTVPGAAMYPAAYEHGYRPNHTFDGYGDQFSGNGGTYANPMAASMYQLQLQMQQFQQAMGQSLAGGSSQGLGVSASAGANIRAGAGAGAGVGVGVHARRGEAPAMVEAWREGIL